MIFPFVLFGLTLAGVALFHKRSSQIAFTGLALITLYTTGWGQFKEGVGVSGLGHHIAHEWALIASLLLLIPGFAAVAHYLEQSEIPDKLPAILPDDWKGGAMLLGIVFVLSSFLDNIAAAMIGGAVAYRVFHGRVHPGFVVAIVAAANAGGTGSVIGDTTTTLIWLAGTSPASVLPAYVGSLAALLVFATLAAQQQDRHHRIAADPAKRGHAIRWRLVFVTATVLLVAITTNIVVNKYYRHLSDHFPFLGVAVWSAILALYPLAKPSWKPVKKAVGGAAFLSALVLSASMMPVEELPAASRLSTFCLGIVSAFFDNIPLTALALKQGGYNPAYLAYTVGFGGTMTWFGSSAGVSLLGFTHEDAHGHQHQPFARAKSLGLWVQAGWHVLLAYVVGCVAMYLLVRW